MYKPTPHFRYFPLTFLVIPWAQHMRHWSQSYDRGQWYCIRVQSRLYWHLLAYLMVSVHLAAVQHVPAYPSLGHIKILYVRFSVHHTKKTNISIKNRQILQMEELFICPFSCVVDDCVATGHPVSLICITHVIILFFHNLLHSAGGLWILVIMWTSLLSNRF
jgi:hypothetical protein